jgi:sulfhydrogenase subunit gamma (sulfur reductase)
VLLGETLVVDAWDEGPLMRGVRLEALPPYKPGQAVRIAHDGVGAFFAIATANGHGRHPELLLRRGGGVADGLIATLRAGARVPYAGPVGPGFPVEEAAGHDVLLCAAGSAISAIRSLLEVLLDERERYGQIALFYGQERQGEFAYERVYDAWRQRGVRLILCARDPEPGWTGARGLIQDVIIADGPQIDPARAVAYLCGMPGMVSGVREALMPFGVPVEKTFLNL